MSILQVLCIPGNLGTSLLLSFFFLLIPASIFAQNVTYSVLEIDGLRGGNSFAMAVNLKGEVVGRSGRLHGTDTHAFLWTPLDRTEALRLSRDSSNSRATDINDNGTVVGYADTDKAMHAFLWTRNGYLDMGTLPGDTSSKAEGINNDGQVVGSSSGPRGQHAFLWSQDKGFLDLGTLPGGQLSEASDINNRGEIVGKSDTGFGTHAFLWSPGGGIEDLGTLPNDFSSTAYAINDIGQVVGSSSGPGGVRAFLWTRSGGMRDIGSLPGAHYTEAFAVNSSGDIVGISGNDGGTRAFLWTSASGMRDLNALISPNFELNLAGALGLNDLGRIVVFGASQRAVTSDRTIEHGTHTVPNRTFLLSPIGTR